jgi:hypothetical protein
MKVTELLSGINLGDIRTEDQDVSTFTIFLQEKEPVSTKYARHK